MWSNLLTYFRWSVERKEKGLRTDYRVEGRHGVLLCHLVRRTVGGSSSDVIMAVSFPKYKYFTYLLGYRRILVLT